MSDSDCATGDAAESSWLWRPLFMVWAAFVGISVPLEMVNTIFLNSQAAAAEKEFHAFFVSNLMVGMGALVMLPLSARAERPVAMPTRWWHLGGGVCALPAFGTVWAGSLLGTQLVLVVQLSALLTTFFIIDLIHGRLRLTEHARIAALPLIFVGVALDGVDDSASLCSGWQATVAVLLVALSGVGFALQSHCNNALAEGLGSTPRAAIVSACVFLLFSVPIDLYICLGRDVRPSFDQNYWYLWFAAGFQSAFYVGSMAYLPRMLGFTSCYVITLAAKLSTSLLVDAKGLVGKVEPITTHRVAALVIVLVGSMIINVCKRSEVVEEEKELLSLSSDEECAGALAPIREQWQCVYLTVGAFHDAVAAADDAPPHK